MSEKPKHIEVHDHDDASVTESTPDLRVMIAGFDSVFLAEAQRAAERARAALDRQHAPGVAGATAAAVLLAAAACEARLSESLNRIPTLGQLVAEIIDGGHERLIRAPR